MKSLMVEFLRSGDPSEGTINRGREYLITTGPESPVREIKMPCSHNDVSNHLAHLRYISPEHSEAEAIRNLSEIVTDVLELPRRLNGEELQLDLVVTVAEIGALPFEAAMDADGELMFVDPGRVVVPTRRVRQERKERPLPWPTKPRVLFAYANVESQKEAARVPCEEHSEALRMALRPWLEPLEGNPQGTAQDPSSVLVELPEATLERVRETLVQARSENKPFTHVHFLAHGSRSKRDLILPDKFEFLLRLRNGSRGAVTAEELADAIHSEDGMPHVVTLAVCDGANPANPAYGVESMAQRLHRKGVPVVVASQLPLTIKGSVLLTQEFYSCLLSGNDVRHALHSTRVKLHKEESEAGFDWLSMVAYVQLPEGYAEFLDGAPFRAVLASLDTVNSWAERFEENRFRKSEDLKLVVERLEERSEELGRMLGSSNGNLSESSRSEGWGLLGSAKKRMAELCFVRSLSNGGDCQDCRERSRRLLEEARDAYAKYRQIDWNGAQWLALDMVLRGQYEQPWRWHALVDAAQVRARCPSEYWAFGSLTELYLLGSPGVGGSRLKEARRSLQEMMKRVRRLAQDDFPIRSARRQITRYRDWWTADHGYFGGSGADRVQEASELLDLLDAFQG